MSLDEPGKRNSHVRKLTFSSMTTLINAKDSLIPMGTFELVMGPRTIATHANGATNARFHASSQYTRIHVISKLYSANRIHHCSVASLSTDECVPADELADAHVLALGEFFSTNSCPLMLLDYDFSNCAANCINRSLNIDNLMQWQFKPSTHPSLRKRMLINKLSSGGVLWRDGGC